jgi:phosphate:Na+ symporter
MYHLEKGINGLAGKSFRKFLKNFTNTPTKGILTGIFTTSILQSSTLMTLLTSAFIGGGLISLQNAISVIIGANIGTTSTAWIVAFLGFKFNISTFANPFLAIGTLTYLFMDNRPLLKSIGSFLMGFGLLFLGIEFMKETMEDMTENLDFEQFGNYGMWMFFVSGIVITAMIQSSSAMMVIILTALHTGAIDIIQASVMTVGANIGTTFSLVMASVKGTADKKRLAASHVIFNMVSGMVSLIFLYPILDFISGTLFVLDPVIQVSVFNTAINVLGAVLFLPFIVFLAKRLQTFFVEKTITAQCKYIHKVSVDVTEIALAALDNEIKNIFFLIRDFIYKVLRSKGSGEEEEQIFSKLWMKSEDPFVTYHLLKQTEDEVTKFYKKLQSKNLSEQESDILAAQMVRLRSLVYAAKNMKDIIANIKELFENEDLLSKKILKKIRHISEEKLLVYSDHIDHEIKEDKNIEWHAELDVFYHNSIDYIYDHFSEVENGSVSVSTLTNVVKKTVSCLEEMANAATDEINIKVKNADYHH